MSTGNAAWYGMVEKLRQDHNGIFGVRLFFGHDGHNVCRFESYEKTVGEGESGKSMQEAVERCVANWHLRSAIGSRINCMGLSYPYDGHWPLTADEELTLNAERWMMENKNRYYALGVSGPAKESDFIVLLSCFLKEMSTAKGTEPCFTQI